MGATTNVTILRRAFVDVCRGYSVGTYQSAVVYVRHVGHFDQCSHDDLQLAYEQEAISKGAQSEADRLVYLVSKGVWSQDKEDKIAKQKDTIQRFEEGKKNLPTPSLIKAQEASIKVEKDRLIKMLTDRSIQIGITAELYAQQRLNDHYIITNLFKDSALTIPLFTDSSFDDFNDSEVEEIMKVYNQAMEPCGDANLRRLSIMPFYMQYYNACDNDASAFFGKPVCEMTYNQTKLYGWSRYYRSLMENNDMSRLTPEQRSDPDRLESAVLAQRNTATMQAEGKVPTNMSQDDLRELGLKDKMSPVPKTNQSFEQLIKHAKSNPR